MVSIIIPVYNGSRYIEHTILSIIEQNQPFQLIVIDGYSTDKTNEIIIKYKKYIDVYISEKDNGLYDALSKGLIHVKGDIVCYINAGDYFYHNAFKTVLDVFKDKNIKWLTGYRSKCNIDNTIINISLPFRYKRLLIQKGSYVGKLPYIQQESTFWSYELNSKINLNKLKTFKLAGDYYLWYTFSYFSNLEIVKSPLGVFKVHDNQLSEKIIEYRDEVKLFTKNINIYYKIIEYIELFFWALDDRLKIIINRKIIKYDTKVHTWIYNK
jgi:glycosyltransferase involved in cell wall biosynthesis